MLRLENSCKAITVVLTHHATQRMRERLRCDPKRLIWQIEKLFEKWGIIYLSRNGRGYEVELPTIGRLVGDIKGDEFVVKTFLLPIYGRRDYFILVGKTPRKIPVIVRKILTPQLHRIV